MKKFFLLLFLAGLVFLSGCAGTNKTATNAQSLNVCTDAGQCELIYDGPEICPPCDKSDASWVCMKTENASLARLVSSITKLTGFFSLLFQQPDCSCSTQEFEYACSCDLGECTKFLVGPNSQFCRQAQDCQARDLAYSECTDGMVGEWNCVENSCKWICLPVQEEQVPEKDFDQKAGVKDCGSDKECFNQALLSCSKAKYNVKNIHAPAGIYITTLIKQEIVEKDEQGFCLVTQIATTENSGNVVVSKCIYDGARQVQCRIASNIG